MQEAGVAILLSDKTDFKPKDRKAKPASYNGWRVSARKECLLTAVQFSCSVVPDSSSTETT